MILLVEDDEKVRRITRKRLVELGYKVMEATTAAQATELLDSNEPVSLVFSDIRMPGEMSGYDLAKWVLENRAGVRVLLTLGYNDFAVKKTRAVWEVLHIQVNRQHRRPTQANFARAVSGVQKSAHHKPLNLPQLTALPTCSN